MSKFDSDDQHPFSRNYRGRIAEEVIEHRRRYPRRANAPKIKPGNIRPPAVEDDHVRETLERIRRK